MATKKKTATATATRPPAEVWLQIWSDGTVADIPFLTKREADEDAKRYPNSMNVAGPYVLAERVRQR